MCCIYIIFLVSLLPALAVDLSPSPIPNLARITCRNRTWLNDPILPGLPPTLLPFQKQSPDCLSISYLMVDYKLYNVADNDITLHCMAWRGVGWRGAAQRGAARCGAALCQTNKKSAGVWYSFVCIGIKWPHHICPDFPGE